MNMFKVHDYIYFYSQSVATYSKGEIDMPNKMEGSITLIRVDRVGIAVSLDNEIEKGPKDNVFVLEPNHINHNAIYSTVLASAANRWDVLIRTIDEFDINTPARIQGVTVEWK